MTGPTWTTDLKHHGITLLPGSSTVPVEVYGLLPDGTALHFRCRGTSVTLRLYDAADVSVAVGVREPVRTELPVTGEVWLAPADVLASAGGRTVLTGAPLAEAVLDGRERFGWTAHEAGLLRPAAAVPLLLELLDDLLGAGLLAAV
jgi:hypothetical protein